VRGTWVSQAYDKLDPSGTGAIELAKIRRFPPRGSASTRVAASPKSPEVLFQKLICSYESEGAPAIPKDEFFDYYREISAGFETEREFASLMRATWGVTF
jgi:hypothetical protein